MVVGIVAIEGSVPPDNHTTTSVKGFREADRSTTAPRPRKKHGSGKCDEADGPAVRG